MMPQPLVWQKRQEMSPQWVIAGPAQIEGIERTEAVMVHPPQRARFVQKNPYIMKVDRSNRNCYNCRGFGHPARYCRNRRTGNRIGEGRRLEYKGQRREEGGKEPSNLNGEGDLIVFN